MLQRLRTRLADEEGAALVFALFILIFLTLSVLVLVELTPLQLGQQLRERQRAEQVDTADAIKSWSTAYVAAATLPLDRSEPDAIELRFGGDCYRLELERSTDRVLARWGAESAGACPSPLPELRVLAENAVNVGLPLFQYYSSSDESAPIADPVGTGDPACIDPPPTGPQISKGRCAKSLTLTIQLGQNGRASEFKSRYRILFGTAVTSGKIANGAVTGPKLGPALDVDRIGDASLDGSELAGGLTDSFARVPMTISSNQNFGPQTNGPTDIWRTSESSNAKVQGGLDFKAGSADAVAAIDWRQFCRPGYLLAARGHYTIFNPQGGDPAMTLGVRLLRFPALGSGGLAAADGTVVLQTTPTSVSSDNYLTARSAWTQIDDGSCNSDNPLLGEDNPYLFQIQTISDRAKAFTLTGSFVEIRSSRL